MEKLDSVKIVVFNSSQLSPTSHLLPPAKVTDLIEWLRAKLEAIPKEFRDNAVYEILPQEGWCEYAVYYYRPETDDEFEERRIAVHRQQYQTRISEIATLERLRAKYPGV